MILGNKKFINAWNIVEGIPAALCIYKYERSLTVLYYNYLLPELLGYPEEQFKKIMTGGLMNIMDYDGRRHYTGCVDYYLEHPDDNDPIDIVYSVVGRNGEKKMFLQKCNFIYEAKGQKLFCCVITDITEQYKNEKLLALYTSMDNLTRIFNRDAVQKDIQTIIITTKYEVQHILIVLNIDDFKALNDKMGHDMCDLYLQKLGRVLVKPYKYGKTAGRIAGDEFVLFVVGVRQEAVHTVAEEVCQQIKESLPELTVSMGISICRNNSADFVDLYKEASEALHYVKEHGKNGFAFYGTQSCP